ncbi:MAG: hypothetical protein KF774_20530 [Planctomyces sp.]|nr:hypothetical protein [Planctomyces sp.]
MLSCRRLPAWMASLLLIAGFGLPVAAQESTTRPAPKVPFAVINVASAERLLSDTEFLFQMIDRPDVFDFVKGLIGDRAGDLKGMDRTKPLGVMLFLESGLPPRPMPVTYVPASNMLQLMQTFELGPVTPRKVSETRYEIEGLDFRGPDSTQLAEFRDGYAIITASRELIDAELPDPVEFNQALTSRYDIAISLRIKSIPPILRDVFLGFLRTQTQNELQRRNDEPEGAYRARKAQGLNTLESIEELLTQCDQFTIGWDGNQELRKGVLELNIQAAPDSDYAKSLKDLAGRGSFFHVAQEDEGKPLTVSISWQMNKREKKTSLEMIEAARMEANRLLPEQMLDTTGANTLCDVLQATAEAGHLDGFVQVNSPSPGAFVVTGGLKLQGADAASTGLTQLLSEISKAPDVKGLDLNVESHQGVNFHRIAPEGEDEGAQRFFGDQPAFWFGAGQRALWFTVGAGEALPTLRDTMDAVLSSGPPPGGESTPFVLVFRQSPWMALQRPEGENRRRDIGRELATEAFSSAGDALRVETRPLENGIRTRVELDEGFLRWLALFLARQYDRSLL